MSMNLFFVAFTQEKLDELEQHHGLIDESIHTTESSLATDVETAWDVLKEILGGVGIEAGDTFIEDALSNGCFLISKHEVQTQADALSGWSREAVLARLKNIDVTADLYHLEVFQNEEKYLVAQFEKMLAFYQEASKKGLGAISYFA